MAVYQSNLMAAIIILFGNEISKKTTQSLF